FVSHNMATVESLCQRAILLTRGKVELDGTPHTVVERYLRLSHTYNRRLDPVVRSEDGMLEMTAVDVLDEESRPVAAVRSGQNVTFRLSLRVYEKIDQGLISIGIENTFGI